MPANEPASNRKVIKAGSARRRRSLLARFMFTSVVTATMIATGGFGTFPPNPVTETAARVIGENFPPEIIVSANLMLAQAAAPTLEVINRPDAQDDNPIVELFESLVEPLFTALPGAPTETIPAATTLEINVTRTENPATATLETNATATQAVAPSPSITLTTPTPVPSQTAQPSSTVAPAPTWTFIYVPPTPTETRQPPPDDTFTPIPSATGTPTGTPTVTSAPSPIPAGHLITSVSLNGGGSSITATGGAAVTVDYTYQVWGDSSTCPGCNFQLLWGLDNNWQTCFGWPSPGPGDYPGISGTSLASGMTVNITAPTTEGTYTIYSTVVF